MRWPWVSRLRLDLQRRTALESTRRAIAAESAADILRGQLELAQRERADLQTKLLRVGFGMHPFFTAEEQLAAAPAQVAPPPPPTVDPMLGASPEQVMEHFTREALQIYGPANMRAVKNFVERQQAAYYSGQQRQNPIHPDPEALAAAHQIQRDLEAAIEEGKREASKE